jgi:hypothetical protein
MDKRLDKSRKHIHEALKEFLAKKGDDSKQSAADLAYLKDRPVLKFVRKLRNEAKEHRGQYTSHWLRYWNFYRGRQWPARRITWREYVDILQGLLDTLWRRRNVLFTLQSALRNAMIFGTGFLKVYWDPDLDDGRGDINVTSPDPSTIYVDPSCTDFDNAEWVLWSDVVSMDHIKRKYPEKAKFVQAGIEDKDFRDERRVFANLGSPLYENVEMVSPVADRLEVLDNTEYSSPPTKLVSQKARNKVMITEAWFRDDETYIVEEKVRVTDPIDGTVRDDIRRVEKEKYPKGRLVTIAGNVVLQDIPSPYAHGEWPFVRIVDNSMPNEFYGTGEVELLEDLQKELNKRRSQATDHANLLGNPVWIIDHDSGVDPAKITNRPGLIVTKMPNREVRREPGTEMPHYIFSMQDQTKSDMQQVTGIHDTLGGQIPRGVRTGAGMIEAQDIASTRIRLKVRNLEHGLHRVARLMIALIQQYYNPARVVRILGKDGAVHFFELDGTKIQGDWDIIIGTGSTLPVSKSLKFEQALRLFQMEAIDQVALLEAADWPGREEIIKRMTGEDAPPPSGAPASPGKPRNKGPSHSLGAAVTREPASPDPTPAFSQTFNQPPPGGVM